MTRKLEAAALWQLLEEQAIEDATEEILAMSDDELDAYIRANGADPAALRASGTALAAELLERRRRREKPRAS